MMAGSRRTATVSEIYRTMEYGPAVEDDIIVKKWLDDHKRRFGHFINNRRVVSEGRRTFHTENTNWGGVVATIIEGNHKDVDTAVEAAVEARLLWGSIPAHTRARHLYSIARHVQKHARLLALVEALDTGKTLREAWDCDVPLVTRHLYHHAGWAQLKDTEMAGWNSLGVMAASVTWSLPLAHVVWKVCPALAMGNTVIFKPSPKTSLSAILFAEICAEAGLPAGVFNVITGMDALGHTLAHHPKVSKVAFTGSLELARSLRRMTAGFGKKLSLELGGKSPVIVFDSADLDSAVEGVVDAIFFNQGQVNSAGSRLLIQEPVFEIFIGKLKQRMKNLRVGPPLDKTMDMGPLVEPSIMKHIAKCVDEARQEGAEVFQVECPPDYYYPPTLITGVGTASRCVIEEIYAPVLVAMPFRTAKEAISLANNTIYGMGASVFTEKMTLGLEVAKMVKAGAVWINCHNMFDAAAGFGGCKQSGYGRDGGKEGLYEYVKPAWQSSISLIPADVDFNRFGAAYMASRPSITPATHQIVSADETVPRVDQTYKLYYGGAQKRPDANYSRVVLNTEEKAFALVGESNRKDVRNAVEAAGKAQSGWDKRSGFNRSQILFYWAENLEQRRKELIDHIVAVTGQSEEQAGREVKASLARLFHWAALCDKYGGNVQETQLYGTVLRINEPVGVIGVACPDDPPLLGFISLVAPAVARGNAVVVVPSEKYPTVALSLYQVLETSDVPAGVINILTGSRDHITKHLTEHEDVQAMWYFGSEDGSVFVEHSSSLNFKRTWVNYGIERDWFNQEQGEGEEFLYHATHVKNIWLTMGDIFAN